jgi:hypothetical protein
LSTADEGNAVGRGGRQPGELSPENQGEPPIAAVGGGDGINKGNRVFPTLAPFAGED